MGNPANSDFVVVGGTGAYGSTMSPFNYNSHVQIPEVLRRTTDELDLIRKRQTLEQITQNEHDLREIN